MRNTAFAAALTAMVLGSMAVWNVAPAHAVLPFKKAFETKYVKPDTPFAAEVKKANCNVCHIGSNKKKRNPYGMAIDQFIEKGDKDPAKIEEALNKAAEIKANPDDPNSPTFGQLIEQGKLPAAQ